MRRYIIGSTSFEAEKPEPGLHVVTTPIGNLGDVTLRALATLAGCDGILCEDTRMSAQLLTRYGIDTKLSPYHDHNAAKLRPAILKKLGDGACLALISDAGMPLVSDPGYKLVREAIAAGIAVHVVPGASATLTALALSGLPSDRFMFCGFLPPKAGERRRVLEEALAVAATLIFFESQNRIVETLTEIARMSRREVAVCRELTKLHEETLRGGAADVAAALAQRPAIKGEITLVVGPAAADEARASEAEIDASLLAAAQALPPGQAAAEIARTFKISRKQAFERLLALRSNEPDRT